MGRSYRKWTEEEVEFLINNYHHMTSEEIGKILNRPPQMVRWKARQLGLKKRPRWTEEEIAFLVKYYKTMRYYEIAEILGRPLGSILVKAHELGLKKKVRSYEWKRTNMEW
mgnify:CR=1 FL=1